MSASKDGKLRPLPRNRLLLLQVLLLGGTVAIALLAAEVGLRLAWSNPNVPTVVGSNYAEYVRLNKPDLDTQWDATGLYAGAGLVRFRTDADGAILGIRHPGLPIAHFYGGSTTMDGAIDEGSRWPELIDTVDGRNFGLAHNNMVNSYVNFKFHLETMQRRPAEAFFMEAANDLIFSEEPYLNTRPPTPQRLFRIYLYDFAKQAYLSSRMLMGNRVRPVDYFRNDPKLKLQRTQPRLSDDEFENYVRSTLQPALKEREAVLEKIIALGQKYGVKITFLTQPDAYREDLKPYDGVDLRTYPYLGGKLFTLSQSARLIALANESTRKVALAHGAQAIDVAGAFRTRDDPGALFYDSFHYSVAGARFFAQVVNGARASQRR